MAAILWLRKLVPSGKSVTETWGTSLGGNCNFKRSRKALHDFFQAGYFCLRGKGISEDNGCTGGSAGMTRRVQWSAYNTSPDLGQTACGVWSKLLLHPGRTSMIAWRRALWWSNCTLAPLWDYELLERKEGGTLYNTVVPAGLVQNYVTVRVQQLWMSKWINEYVNKWMNDSVAVPFSHIPLNC